jgi:hypothetical protein
MDSARTHVHSDKYKALNGMLKSSRDIAAACVSLAWNACAVIGKLMNAILRAESADRGQPSELQPFYEAPKNMIAAPGRSKDARISAVPASVGTTLTFKP